MAKNNIHTRHELAKRLPIGRATVYEAFNADWSGYATDRMLALLATHLAANIGPLVSAHQTGRKTGPKGRKP